MQSWIELAAHLVVAVATLGYRMRATRRPEPSEGTKPEPPHRTRRLLAAAHVTAAAASIARLIIMITETCQ